MMPIRKAPTARTSSSSAAEGDRSGAAAAAPLDSQRAYVLALRWVAGRELSTSQIRDRLVRQRADDGAIDAVIGRLTREGIVDDRRAALSIARVARDIRRQGPYRVTRELEARGIPREIAREVVAETFDDTDESALIERALARRLRGSIDSPAQHRRLYQYLLRQGFPAALIVRALDAHAKGR